MGRNIQPRKTFGIYINHFRKAATLFENDEVWLTPDVRPIADGIRNAQGASFAFPNYFMTPGLVRLVLRRDGRKLGNGSIPVVPIPLRVPAGTIQLTVPNPNGKTTEIRPSGA